MADYNRAGILQQASKRREDRRPEKKPRQPVKKVSDKRKKEHPEYIKLVKAMAAESNECEIKSPDCTKIMEGLQHMKRRGANLQNRKYLKRACNACNGYCEKHPKWAFENGHAISKFSIDE